MCQAYQQAMTNPITNLLIDGETDIQIYLTVPRAYTTGVVLPIRVLCTAIQDSLDADWPIADFDHTKNTWTLKPSATTKKIGHAVYIKYRRAQLDASTIVKLFYQAGWELGVIAWEPQEKQRHGIPFNASVKEVV